jgi:uncharacterized protein
MNPAATDVSISVADEELLLLPERAVFWRRRSTLFIADVHIGKAATFRAAGSALPRGTTTIDLERLSGVLERSGASRLVILGDLYHARAGQVDETMDVLVRWRQRHRDLNVEVIRGNHDARSNPSPVDLGFSDLHETTVDGPFVLTHHPVDSRDGYVLCGHVHPGHVLKGIGGERLRLPCFRFGRRAGILPAFGSFTGLAFEQASRSDRVFVIADGAVFKA